jgi:hypothetical protein
MGRELIREGLVTILSLAILLVAATGWVRQSENVTRREATLRRSSTAFEDVRAEVARSGTERCRVQGKTHDDEDAFYEFACLVLVAAKNVTSEGWDVHILREPTVIPDDPSRSRLVTILDSGNVAELLAAFPGVMAAGGPGGLRDRAARMDRDAARDLLQKMARAYSPEINSFWSGYDKPGADPDQEPMIDWSLEPGVFETIHRANQNAILADAASENAASYWTQVMRPFHEWPDRFLVTLAFLATVTFFILLFGSLFITSEIQGGILRWGAFALSMPTFVVALFLIEQFHIRPVPPNATPVLLRYAAALICTVVASGILFEVVQVFLATTRNELRSSYVAGLRTFGVEAGTRRYPVSTGRRFLEILSYFGSVAMETLLPRKLARVLTTGAGTFSRSGLAPFILRAVTYHDLATVKRRLPYLLDALLLVGILFELNETIAGGLLESARQQSLDGMIELTVGVVLIGLVFRVGGTLLWHRLFR